MEFVSKNIIKMDRELSDLDIFTLDFVRILRKHTHYVVVSGYVSILLGRSRASEDVDIIIPKLSLINFAALLHDLQKKGFYCLNAEDEKSIYEYLKDKIAVRFAKEKTAIPNIELKFAKNKFDDLALDNIITVKIGKEEIIISHLELQIAFKEVVLKSSKDIEDARHIRDVADGHLDNGLINRYKAMLDGF
jgi:hypothetical protein